MRDGHKKSERLTHFAEIAGAVGLTIVGLRNMKPGALTEEIRLVRHALTKATEETADLSIAKMWGHGKKTLTEFAKNFAEHYEDDLGPIELNSLHRNTFLGASQQKINLRGAGKDAVVTSIFNDNVLRTALQEGVRGALSDKVNFKDEIVDKRTNQIIDMLITKNSEAIKETDQGLPVFTDKFLRLIEDTYGKHAPEALDEIGNIYNRRQELLRLNKEDIGKQVDAVADALEKFETFESRFSKKKTSFFDKVLDIAAGYKTATVKDVLEHPDQIKETSFHGSADTTGTIIDELKKLVSKDSRFNDLVLDNALKIKNDTLVYFDDLRELENKFEEKFLYRGMGKLLKPIQQLVSRKNQDTFYFIGKNTTDYFLQVHAEGKYTGRLQNQYVRILDKTFRFNNQTLEHVAALDNFYMINSVNGFEINQIKNMLGEISYKAKKKDTTDNKGFKFLKKLDLFQDVHLGLLDKIDYAFKKRVGLPSTYDKMYVLRNEFLTGQLSKNHPSDMYQYGKKLLKELDNYTETLSNDSLDILSEIVSKDAQPLLQAAKSKKGILEYIDNLSTDDFKAIRNEDLRTLIKRYQKNSLETVNSKYFKSVYGESLIGQRASRYTKTIDFYDQMRKELTKEAMLSATKGLNIDKPYEDLFKKIASSVLSPIEKEKAKRHFHIAQFSEALQTGVHTLEQKDKIVLPIIAQQVGGFFSGSETEHLKDFNRVANHLSNLEKMRKKVSDEIAEAFQRDIVESNRPNRHVHLQKGISPLDIIKNLNVDTMQKGLKQFVAGRNDMENVTSYTLFPYFILNRLQADVRRFGIGLSREDIGSVGDIAKNIVLKRALPAYAVGFGLSYLNDLSKSITGTSLKGAAASSIAQFDLGLKTITDIAQRPLKDAYYWFTPLNYLADNEYQTKEEKRKWYETGYSPVKEGKFWPLGSSEFFGGKTTYFQPNYVKRSQVEWRDIGIYGSSKDKWAHSLIPTPTHPLSTIRYLLDPYWLERKQKYHRPYPVSGPMFDTATPWGFVGNMTIGQMIKPQKRLNKEFMLPSGIDVRDIVAQINNRIRTKAQGKYNTFTIKSSDTFIENDVLRTSDITGNINQFTAGDGGIVAADTQTNSFLTNSRGSSYTGSLAKYSVASEQGYSQSSVDTAISKTDKMFIAYHANNVSRQAILDEIERINTGIKIRARLSYGYDTNLAKEHEQNAKRDVVDLLRESSIQADLRNISSTKELLSNAAYSVGELAGIYGFLTEQIIPTRKKYAFARSNSMYNMSNRFWQTGMTGFDIGGTEGGPMEIIRRFIPHENRNRIRLNPLRNDMPSWLPERFARGDAYTLIKKGEMRLPGPAYEALHEGEDIINQTLGPSVISGSKDDILNYLIHGSATADASLNRDMEEGTEMHNQYEKLLLKSGLALSIEGELKDEANGIHGFYDVMLKDNTTREGRSVMDIKTVNTNNFAKVQSEGVDEKHKRQVNYYLGLLGLSKGYVMYVNRDKPDQMLTYSFNFNKDLYNDTLNNLKQARKEFQELIDTHQLSPYENYSDFHKFQILADVAPGSAEYKKYRQIVAANLKDDPEKTEAYEATLKRVEEQSKKHKFYRYKFTHTKMSEKNGVVESVDGNTFKLVNDPHIYNLAGVSVRKDRLEEYIKAGQEILIQFEANKIERQKVNAIAFAEGMNINRKMLQAHDATHDDDGSATAARAVVTPAQAVFAKPFEIIAHSPIPYIHNKFMRVDTPLQSWLNEHVYGTTFQSWSHPIETIIKPSLRKDMAMPLSRTLTGIGAFALNEYLHYASEDAPVKKTLTNVFEKITPGIFSYLHQGDSSKTVESLANHFFKFSTPGAFTGSVVERVLKLNRSDEVTRTGARIGATIALAGSLFTKSNNPFVSVSSGAGLGYLVSDFLERDSSILGEGIERVVNEFIHNGKGARGAFIGATIGLGITAAKTDFNFKKMFGAKWIPKETEKRWEIEEYFDRLEYIKYKGLFERASYLAERKEHVNIKKILKEYEKREKNFDKELEEIVTLKHQFESGPLAKDEEKASYFSNILDRRYNDLLYDERTVPAGEFVRSALAYKQAMESTVYALNENSSYAQILRAIPAYERDYYLEFMNESDPSEQRKILASIAPYKRKILQNAWGMTPKRQKSNYEYFQGHYLPNMFWKGWHADRDIEQVKIKTIENEGMQLSDFGYYDSAKDDPRYKETAPIEYKQTMNPIKLHANLVTALNGIGLSKADVSIEPRNERGIHLAINVAQVGVHRLKNGIRDVLGAVIY